MAGDRRRHVDAVVRVSTGHACDEIGVVVEPDLRVGEERPHRGGDSRR